MADLLPSIPDASAPEDAEPRVVGLEDEEAEEVLGALSSTTARELFAAINEDPAHPSALADRVDTSLQNVQYHIAKLEDAGMVEVVDTAYSAKGREMDVYAPADRPLVVFAGDEADQTLLDRALGRLLGGVGVLAGASLALRGLASAGESPVNEDAEVSPQGGGAAPTGTDGGDADVGGDAGDGGGSGDGGAPPDGGGSGDDGSMDGGSTDSSGDGAADTTGETDSTGGMDSGSDGAADTTGGTDSTGGADGGGTESAGQVDRDGGQQFDLTTDPQPEQVEPLAQDLAWLADPFDATGLPPELAFFLLGSVLLAVVGGAWYWRKRQTRV